MKKYICTVMVLSIVSLSWAQQMQPSTENITRENLKKWTIENSLSARFIKDVTGYNDSVCPSPDGNYFYFIERTTDLISDDNIYKLKVFSTKEVLSELNKKKTNNISIIKPLRTAIFSTGIFLPVNRAQFGWTNDSKSILFEFTDALFGNDPRDTSRLYLLNISNPLQIINSINFKDGLSGESRKIGNCSKDASTIIFSLSKSIKYGAPLYNTYPELATNSEVISNLLFCDGYKVKDKTTNYLYHKGKISELPEYNVKNSWPSPDGNKLIFIQRRADVPSSWLQQYKSNGKSSIDDVNGITNEFDRFMIVDCNNTTKIHPVIEAPCGANTIVGSKLNKITQVLWTPDNNYAILINSALPVDKNKIVKDTMSYILAVNVENGKYQTIESMITKEGTVGDVSWNKEENELLITFMDSKNKINKVVGYKREKEQWVKDISAKNESSDKYAMPQLVDGLKVFVRQDASTPPMIVATNGKQEIYLTEPDSTLIDVYIAPSRTIKWKIADGRELKGGLTLPREYVKGKPLPLIIQNYGFEPTLFKPDGVAPSGYATQSLAANGFAVVQLDLSQDDLEAKYGNPSFFNHIDEEGPAYVEKIDAVVQMLADSGIVDASKVGLIGFSRGGYETLYAITHPGKIKFAAAMDLDGFSGTFPSYLLDNLTYDAKRSYEDLYKGIFWENKAEWLKGDPTFNVDKVVTPLCLSAHTYAPDNVRQAVYGYSDLLGAFKLAKKPLEFLIYPRGLHNLFHPRERYAALTTTIDWMNFWLKGVEDTDPAKAEKYQRWREFRKMQDAVMKEKGAGNK